MSNESTLFDDMDQNDSDSKDEINDRVEESSFENEESEESKAENIIHHQYQTATTNIFAHNNILLSPHDFFNFSNTKTKTLKLNNLDKFSALSEIERLRLELNEK
jgi:hypothetical protein